MRPLLLALGILLTVPLSAQPYHLELEATPAAVFPYLGRFGNVALHVYSGGVRADALWLHAFSRNDAAAVTVVNPLARMYVDVQVADIASILTKLAGAAAGIERAGKPLLGPTSRGEVQGIAATRHRLLYGPEAWIDVWTTDVVPANRQMQRIVRQIVSGISPHTGPFLDKLTGTPIYVEVNFRRFKKITLLRPKKLSRTVDDQEEALTLGKLYLRATVLEKLFTSPS
ncbi:MAG TPA: hypothetical protein VF215_02235 [Thermoanaerobaculia bacterium]